MWNLRFDSLAALLKAAQLPQNTQYAGGGVRENGHGDFYGTHTFDGAIELARKGWDAGRVNMTKAMARAKPIMAKAAAYTLDVAGTHPHTALAAAGAVDCMFNPAPVSDRLRPIVRLAINRWASCAYKADEFTNYGAAVLSYVDALEDAGFRVEIDACAHCETNGSRLTYHASCIVKDADEPLEIDRLTYVLTHPSYTRRLHFAVMQNRPGDDTREMRNCGQPKSLLPEHVDNGVIIVPGINIIPPGDKRLKTPEAAAKALAPILDDLMSAHGVTPPALAFGGGKE